MYLVVKKRVVCKDNPFKIGVDLNYLILSNNFLATNSDDAGF